MDPKVSRTMQVVMAIGLMAKMGAVMAKGLCAESVGEHRGKIG